MQTNIVWSHSYMEPKKTNKLTETDDLWLPEVEGWGEGELEEGGQKVQTSSYKINKYYGCNVQHGDYS